MVRRQGGASGRAGVLPHGRLLRAVLRGRGGRGRRTRHRADPARRARRQADPDVRRAAARRGGVSRPADPPRLPRRGGRADGGPQTRPQGRNAKAPLRRDVVRLVTPGTITEEALLEAGRANLLLGTGAGPRRHRRGLAGRVHRPVRDRRAGAGGSARPARPAGAGGDPVAAGAAARRMGRQARARCRTVAASGGAAAAGGDVRRRQRGRVRQLHGRRGDRGADGGGLCARHPGRHAAAARPPGAAGPDRAAGDGCVDARQPGDPSGARRRRAAHAVRHGAADADAGRGAAAGGVAGGAAHRSGGDRGAAGCVGVDGGGARGRRAAAGGVADGAGHRAGARAAVGGAGRAEGPGGAARWAARGARAAAALGERREKRWEQTLGEDSRGRRGIERRGSRAR